MTNIEKFVYIIICTIFRLLSLIPLKQMPRLAGPMGHFMFLADKKHREIALNNLTRALGHKKGAHEIRRLAKRVFKNLILVVLELGWSLGLNRNDLARHFSIEGLSRLEAAYRKGKGVLVLTAHFGNWELLTAIGTLIGHPTSIVVRPLDFAPAEAFFKRLRTRYGASLIRKDSMRSVLGRLKEGHMVGILMDQNVDWYEGVFVDFFGDLACTSKGLALLALKTKAPVIPLFLRREASGFRAEVGAEVPLIKTGSIRGDLEANTEQYNQIIQSFVDRYPEQWFWVHQRWKTRPFCVWPRKDR